MYVSADIHDSAELTARGEAVWEPWKCLQGGERYMKYGSPARGRDRPNNKFQSGPIPSHTKRLSAAQSQNVATVAAASTRTSL